MKKYFLLFISFGASSSFFSQENKAIHSEFEHQNIENQAKLDSQIKNKSAQFSTKVIEEQKARLSGFSPNNIPVFLQADDSKANNSANILPLQNGTMTGLNGTAITGSSQNILVMDAGKIFEKQNEFGGPSATIARIIDKENGAMSYNFHPTNVAGILGASGANGSAKGVLPEVKIDNYSFYTLNNTLGTNYQKLTNAVTANISNHSYGINLGWYKATSTDATYTQVGWYWVGSYTLNALDTYSGSYYTQDQNYDQIVYANPNHIVVKSSGNYYGLGPDGVLPNFKWNDATSSYVPFAAADALPANNCSLGYYCIGWGALAKNIIVVGSADQLTTTGNIYNNSGDVVHSSYSSSGPRRDGAIKPDISAVGANMYVANYTNSTTYNAYGIGSGTSYSAPVISGIAGALTEVNRNVTGNSTFTYKGDEMKALLTHTANEAGNPGPDVTFGWGFADAQKGAQVILDKANNKAIFERKTLTSGVPYEYSVTGISGQPLKATISWIDPAGTVFTTDNDLQNNHSSKIINDLDLKIVDQVDNTVYYPWKLDVSNPMANATKGDNTVDNVEQVVIDNPVNNRIYKVIVSNKGTLVNNTGAAAPSNYALIVTGYNSNATLATQNTTKNEIVVYPTITHDFVTVLIPSKPIEISVVDASGKKLFSVPAKENQMIDFGKYPKGIYILNVKSGNGNLVKKIIKN